MTDAFFIVFAIGLALVPLGAFVYLILLQPRHKRWNYRKDK